MDSKLDDLLNPRPNLSMTRSMLNPKFPLDFGAFGWVLRQKEVLGFTLAVDPK